MENYTIRCAKAERNVTKSSGAADTLCARCMCVYLKEEKNVPLDFLDMRNARCLC